MPELLPPEETGLPEEIPEPEILILDLTDSLPPQLPAAPGYAGAASDDSDKPLVREGKRDRADRDGLKTGPPNAEEWNKFFALTVLRLLTEGYLYLVLFRDIDEELLTPRERELISLSREDLLDITAPVSVVVARQKFARKHGRELIALSDSFESIVDLFVWMRRVNKIARKYRSVTVQDTEYTEGVVVNGPVPGSDEQGPAYFPGFAGGRG